MESYDEQIRHRIEFDEEAFRNSLEDMAGVVMGQTVIRAMQSDHIRSKSAILKVMRYYHLEPAELPDEIKDVNEQMDYLMQPEGMMRRVVILNGKWYKNAIGAYIAVIKETGETTALIPDLFGRLCYTDSTGKKIRINKKTAGNLESEAICFYRPFPMKEMGIRELLVYGLRSLSFADLAFLVIATLLATGAGTLLPPLNNIIYSVVVKTGTPYLIGSIFFSFASISIYIIMLNTLKELFNTNISLKIQAGVQAASMIRMLSLPSSFFQKYSAGNLTNRNTYITEFVKSVFNTIFSTGLSSVFSLAYISQMVVYGHKLAVAGLLVILAIVIISLINMLVSLKLSKKRMEAAAAEQGLAVELIAGTQKIKLAGAEKRAFSKWAEKYAASARLQYDPPMIIKAYSVMTTAVSLLGTIVLYYFAVNAGTSVADYYSFNSAYQSVMAVFMSLISATSVVANLRPMYQFVKPILECVPEIDKSKERVVDLDGAIELSHVTFRYEKDGPEIISDLSLKINPGEYVAIVGKTGCGKSTLMRLILGMENPERGFVMMSGKNLASLDLKSVRRRIGTVLQNGQLFTGDIYSNIVVTNPRLTMDEAWDAAEKAGIADDIRRMPMNMHTLISEGAGGISGGQRQRILIARAIAPKPKILMFDEATSALDNITQKMVSDSLDQLNCTRIVIAHRLSTIRNADRIVYLEGGRIAEEGSYDELIAKNGKFAELVDRQRLDK